MSGHKKTKNKIARYEYEEGVARDQYPHPTELNSAVETWRRRDLSGELVKYMFVDGAHFHMVMGRSIEIGPGLMAIGWQNGRKAFPPRWNVWNGISMPA